ncbi:hypothetical protein LG52_2236 [Geobacillus kaustophilus]|uniref:Uncharacterized protein n=1 Tax=Geobacillus kaustophilus TaxID=1462 RepID=A0A0D8BUP8_GEOKU|nr:hypothetical protein LG52_2236 [Geobacillus kaustophilus]
MFTLPHFDCGLNEHHERKFLIFPKLVHKLSTKNILLTFPWI